MCSREIEGPQSGIFLQMFRYIKYIFLWTDEMMYCWLLLVTSVVSGAFKSPSTIPQQVCRLTNNCVLCFRVRYKTNSVILTNIDHKPGCLAWKCKILNYFLSFLFPNHPKHLASVSTLWYSTPCFNSDKLANILDPNYKHSLWIFTHRHCWCSNRKNAILLGYSKFYK